MNLLRDTHIFLWFISNDPRLKQSFAAAIQSAENDVYLSAMSVWEATIKQQIGKLPLPGPAPVYMPALRAQHEIESLALFEADIASLYTLPLLHRDPFDRILVAQASHHNLTIVTDDAEMKAYTAQFLAPDS